MFANTLMFGADPSFPEDILDSKPAPAPAGASPSSMGWMDAVLPPHTQGGQGGPAGGLAPMTAMGGFAGALGALASYLPQVAPAVGGGLIPGAPRPSGAASTFQRDSGLKPSGELSGGTVDALRSAHGS
ncbi:MAG: hypothetical protein ACM31C_11335 [Acidobacteriota bacterium]